jgi:dihydroflavonol-4-reductase
MTNTVLFTSGSGFVGSHVVLQLLNAGHTVGTSVRSLEKERPVRSMLEKRARKREG